MRQYIEPFVVQQITTCQTEDEITSYYDESGEILAEAYFHDGDFYSAVFYGTGERQTLITKQQAEEIVKHVQVVFQQEQLIIDSIVQIDNEFIVELKMIEPVYNMPVRGTGMNITISATGSVGEVTLNDNDFTITYPEKLVSKEEARAILQQQPVLTLGIAPELGWQYVYKQNFDLYGIAPDGTVRLWSKDELMQDASFEPLPKVEDISDLEDFLKGGLKAIVESTHNDDEERWFIESDEQLQLKEDVFERACKVGKHSLQEANHIAQQLIDVELTLERDIHDRKKLSFVYSMDYPTSPTGGHIQYVDGFTGEIHWVNTGWT